jgi:hypothetical protein
MSRRCDEPRLVERAPDRRIVLSAPFGAHADTGEDKKWNDGGRDQPQKARSDPGMQHRLLASRNSTVLRTQHNRKRLSAAFSEIFPDACFLF